MRQELQDRALCPHYNIKETMAHILMECKMAGQSEIWKAAEQLWNRKKPGSWYCPVPAMKTWDGVLRDTRYLSDDWSGDAGVLMGMGKDFGMESEGEGVG